MNRYSTEEKQQAIDLYFKNGCNMKNTVRELGCGSATGILRWLGFIRCLSPAKKYKLYKSSINKSIHFVQRSLSSSTRG